MYLDYKNKKTYVIDIETDSLQPTVIWCMCWEDVLTGEIGSATTIEGIREFFKRTSNAVYVGHNILKFDAPVLARLADIPVSVANCIDTLILSTLYSPSLLEGHSLGAWGERLGHNKIDFHDWSGLSPEMLEYCHRDVSITCQLFRRLIKTLDRIGFSEKSIWIQHRLTVILDRQQQVGFYFDGPRALDFYSMLRSREQQLTEEIQLAFPATETLVRTSNVFTKDGRHTAIYEKDVHRYRVVISGDSTQYQAYESVPFGIGSSKQRIEKLVQLGWQPLEFTEKTKKGGGGNPKPFDKGDLSPSLKAFLEEHPKPEVEMIARWMSINGRGNMVNNWIENWNEDTGCIHGKLFVADTLRLRHQAPNTANIPAVRQDKEKKVLYGEPGYFTYEARDLWCARPGRVLVGTDAAGLELRMLAHFLNRPAFTEQVVEGDPHQYNADLVGITRPQAKTLIYAILYGAGDVKIARTLGLPVLTKKMPGYGAQGRIMEYSPEGKAIKEAFLEKLGVGDLIDEAQKEQQNGRVTLVDGSKVICPSPHSSLNYKLQGSGARVMALGAIILENSIKREKLDTLKVGDIHDEWQYDTLPDHSHRQSEVSVEAIISAGAKLQLNVPLDGTAKIGKTWAETH